MYFQRLRDLREDMDLNQTQIAEILHTSQTVLFTLRKRISNYSGRTSSNTCGFL